MAPPRKRRRLSQSLPSASEMALFEPVPTLTHSASNLECTPDLLYGARTVPKRIEELHLHIQERSVALEHDQRPPLGRRQIEYTVTTVDAQGQTITSVVTAGLSAGAATATTAVTSTSSTTSGTTASSTTTHNHVASSGKISVAAVSSNSTIPAGRATTKSIRKTTDTTHKTTLPLTTHITLTNGNVKTITRSLKPYVTTFSNSEVSTICDRYGRCRVAGATMKQSPTETTSDQSSVALGAGGAGPSSSATTASPAPQNSSDGSSSPPLATIAGGVVGGAAGLAVLLIIALIFLRWYKRRLRQGQHRIARSSSPTPEPEYQSSAGQSGMAERAGLTPLVNAMPAFFRHQDKSQEESISGERGFARVSGRKLPSAFSEGVERQDMAGPLPDRPVTGAETDLRNASFYRDSTGFYGGDGVHYETSESPEPKESGEPGPASMTLSPGPQRRPTIHEPGPYMLSPSTSWPSTPVRPVRGPSGPGLSPFEVERSGTPSTAGRSETPTLARSETPSTIGDNRSSRFTEDV